MIPQNQYHSTKTLTIMIIKPLNARTLKNANILRPVLATLYIDKTPVPKDKKELIKALLVDLVTS